MKAKLNCTCNLSKTPDKSKARTDVPGVVVPGAVIVGALQHDEEDVEGRDLHMATWRQ